MNKMSNETIALRIKWAEALESGRYEQGFFHLKQRNDPLTAPLTDQEHFRYCCLGVAMAELGDHTWDQSGGGRHLSLLPCELLGIDHEHNLNSARLIELNDGGETFKQIAHQIRITTPEPTKEPERK